MYRGLSFLAVAALALVTVTAQAANRQDPLRPPGYGLAETLQAGKKEAQAETWLVNEILHSEGRRVAIVNNVTVRQGDTVNGARVIDITADQVTLKYKDRIIKSRLSIVPVKKLKTNNTGR